MIVSYGPGPERFGELSLPVGQDSSGSMPLVVLIHGGFWRDQYRLDLMHPLCEALNTRGYPCWNIEYRRVGQSGGGYPATLEDVAAAIDHVAPGDWPALAVVGHSAGGHLALWNASRRAAVRRPDLTIGLAPVADVIAANRNGVGLDATANFFGGDVDAVPERYEHGQPNPQDFAGRVVLIHGNNDDNVPVAQSRAIAAYVDRLEVLDGVDHFAVIDPDHASWQVGFEELDALCS